MSRVGNKIIKIPGGVEIKDDGKTIKVKGKLGELSERMIPGITYAIENESMVIKRADDSGELRAKHGLFRALLNNLITGVSTGFTKVLEIQGVGYRASVSGKTINFQLGFSHPCEFKLPEGIDAKVEENTKIFLTGSDKQVLGQVAAKIRELRPPEPYKGKGIRYRGEAVRKKIGKAAKK